MYKSLPLMRPAVLLGEGKQDTRERRKSSLNEEVSFCVDTDSRDWIFTAV